MQENIFNKTRRIVLITLVLWILLPSVQVSGQKVPTPIATGFTIEIENTERHALGWALPLMESTDQIRVGLLANCDRMTGMVEAIVYFGFFPPEKPVQLAVRMPDGTGWFYGHPVVAGARSGMHVPIISDSVEARDFFRHALVRGSLISNGHNSFWNLLPEDENERALKMLETCEGS